ACESVCTRNPPADLSYGRTALNAGYSICGSHSLRRVGVDRRHLHYHKATWSQALIGFSFLQGKIAAIVFTAFFLTATLFLLKRLVTDGRDGSPSRPLGASHGAARPAVAPYHAASKAGTCPRSQKWRSPVLIRRW